MKIPLSVVVLTKNEEACIAACLDSLRDWASEIIVVDDESSDQTVEIVKSYTDKVFVKKMDVEGRHRNWAYAQAGNNWVLSLDADEKVTPELKEEIAACVNSTSFAAFSIPLRNYIGSYWVRYGGWYPASKVRLFRKDKFKYEEVEVHPRVFIDGECGHLKQDIIHKGYPDLEHFLNSINRQSTLEAVKWINTNRRMSLGRIIWRTVDRFFRRYLRKKGHKDGLYGFIIAYFDSLYQIISYAKFKEMQKKNVKAVFLDRDGVINEYPGDFKYVTSPQQFRLLPTAARALKKISAKGFKLFIISNQAGVGKGEYSQAALDLITKKLLDSLKIENVEITGVYYCTHRSEDNCSCRKPKAGLVQMAVLEAKKEGITINMAKSYFVGDTIRDVETGKSAGLKTILVFSGKEKPDNKNNWRIAPDFTASDLSQAANIILKQ